MRRHEWTSIVALFLGTLVALWSGTSEAIEAVRPTLVVYIVENQPLTRDRPTIPETIANAELIRRGYKILPSLLVPNLPQMLPRDVRGVWNSDRRMSFQKHFRADVVWMGTVEYKPDKTARVDQVTGTVSVVARAFDTATGESLWFGRDADRPLSGATLAEAGRLALAEILPEVIASFDREPKVRAWVPSERPQPWPAEIPLATRTPDSSQTGRSPALTPAPTPRDRSGEPYTGVIIEADHLRVQPSFRSGIYSQRGSPICGSEGQRVRWSESMPSARQQAGPNPLVLKALSSDRGRIILRDSDARTLQRESAVLSRKPVTVVVQPPKR